ncbi:MAG: D-aminoacylase [Planctomycetota bacterium]|nr:D-aminoacylase [Planctomycetota bacterium]
MNHDRRTILKAAACSVGAALIPGCTTTRREHAFDLVVHGGLVVDGNGTLPRRVDVGVSDRRIAYLGVIDRERARRAIDATGLVVAPGFVDMHSHSDRSILSCPTADSRVMQGYTCEITGNCGGSAAPTAPDSKRKFPRVRDYLAAVAEARPSIHQALLIGHGTLRENRIGAVDRELTATELADVSREFEQALDDGAFGLSSGLEYVPGIYTPPQELIALAKIVARRRRMYASHMRSEDARLVEAVDEALTLARESGARVQISHLKSCGRANWPKVDTVIRRIESAVQAGLDVRADVYPYTAYSTTLTILLEPWAREGETEDLMKRLRDPAARARMRDEVIAHVANEPGGFDLIAIASELDGSAKGMSGKSVAEIAAFWRLEPIDAYLRLLEEERGSVSYVGHAMQESDVARILAHPLTMIGSDGTVQRFDREGSVPHPRSFGTAPRVLGRFVRELRALDLQTAVRKLSSLPAERAQLVERGRIEPQFHADLVVFDAATIADRATFENPRQAPVGITHVIVAGETVVEHGRHTDARPGSVLTAMP